MDLAWIRISNKDIVQDAQKRNFAGSKLTFKGIKLTGCKVTYGNVRRKRKDIAGSSKTKLLNTHF